MCTCCLAESQFNALRSSSDVAEIASAWRVSGGAFFKVQLQRSIVCDTSHLFSLKAINHICELVIIVVCFGCTVGVMIMLVRSPQLERERKQAGENTWRVLIALFGVTMAVGGFTVRTLIKRWRMASTEVFSSEV